MKTFKTALAVITAALLGMALLASPSSAAIGVDDQPVSGSLNPWDTATSAPINPAPTSFETGQGIRLQANLPTASAGRSVKLYKVGSATAVATATANSSGNAYFDYTVISGAQQLFAEDSADLETETDTYTGNDPVPQTGVLNAPTNNGKNWTADFTPAIDGKATKLQIQRIWTKETDEVNEAPGTPEKGPWVTIATANQNAAGHVVFPTLSSPYPYRVEHNYRATSGGTNISPTVKFGLGQVTPKTTGVAAVYFNTNEGHAVDTRTRYFEGTFAMKAGALGCGNVGYTDGTQVNDKPLKESVMKGRGNYSWTFKRKSFTLKLGKKTDLCGMGISKKYALVSQDYDKSFMRNPLAGFIGSQFTNMAWTPKSKPVDLYLNGSYRGAYLLIERIAIQGSVQNATEEPPDTLSNRVNIHELNGDDPSEQVSPGKTGGYILEWDFRKGADYNVNLGSDSGYVGVKEPENDYDRTGANTGEGISSAHKSYISSYLNSADNAMRKDSCQSSDWKNYIDEKSAIDYYLAMEYMKPVDGNMWASVYMYKPREGKLFFGPMWDFDLAAGSATRAGNVASPSSWYLRNNLGISAQQSSNTWFNCLNKRTSFRTAAANRWNDIQDTFSTNAFIDEYKLVLKDSAETSFSEGPSSHSYRISDYQVIKSNYDADVSYLKGWASSRKSWINSQF